MRIPKVPLILGLVALIPFIWGAATLLNGSLMSWGASQFGPRFVGPYVQLFYGTVNLTFMSGILWGFATKARGALSLITYALAAIPMLWAFIMTGGGPISAGMNLIFGFAGLLLLDFAFYHWRLTPNWWLRLRLFMTAVTVACLAIVVWG
ncbi:DUF3429 domain-containing protein [Pontibaca salina]